MCILGKNERKGKRQASPERDTEQGEILNPSAIEHVNKHKKLNKEVRELLFKFVFACDPKTGDVWSNNAHVYLSKLDRESRLHLLYTIIILFHYSARVH